MSDTSPTPNPLYDFANEGSLQGVIEQFLTWFKASLDNMMPATIVSYDRVSNRASVQPQIKMVTTDNTLVSRAPLATVPVLALGGGGFALNFPLVAGARGWIHASDRDTSLYLQNMAQAAPNTARMHSFSDGMFIPDNVQNIITNAADENAVALQSLDGNYRVSVSNSKIILGAGASGFEVVVQDGSVTVDNGVSGSGNINFNFSTSTNRGVLTTPRFDVSSPEINFTTAPHIGTLPP